jgi:hypothetical protein
LFATIASEISSTDLTPASGRQDHTASPSARNVIRLLTKPASIASRLNVRDDRDTPLVRAGRKRCRSDLGLK